MPDRGAEGFADDAAVAGREQDGDEHVLGDDEYQDGPQHPPCNSHEPTPAVRLSWGLLMVRCST